MYSISRPIINLTRGHKVASAIELCAHPIYNHHSEHKLLAYCTTLQSHQLHDDAVGRDSQKIKLSERIRSLQEKPRPFALPNLISATRLFLSPLAGYAILHNMNSCALACVAAAAFTDIADKAMARFLKYTSFMQPTIDFVADKIFTATTMICLYKMDYMPMWLIKGLVIREVIFSGGVAFARYFSFRHKPTMKKYLDFHNYPTLGAEANNSGRLLISLQYALYAYYLYEASHGISRSQCGWDLMGLELATAATSSVTLGLALSKILFPLFYSRPIKQ